MVGLPNVPRSPQPVSSHRMITTLGGRALTRGAAGARTPARRAGAQSHRARAARLVSRPFPID
ncbi:MAG: hypothetical protein DMF78_09470 [Acidobacteria bacterium]|nr:MAG: hypothetical protein DMF78_09470 [Acidobacteriota bacterium]